MGGVRGGDDRTVAASGLAGRNVHENEDLIRSFALREQMLQRKEVPSEMTKSILCRLTVAKNFDQLCQAFGGEPSESGQSFACCA